MRYFLFLIVFVPAGTAVGAVASKARAVHAISTFRDCSECPEMVVVPAGRFAMGATSEETAREVGNPSFFDKLWAGSKSNNLAREVPRHTVIINRSFALGRYPVTRGEFAAFIRNTRHQVKSGCTLWNFHKYHDDLGADWRNPGFSQTDRDPVVCVSWDDAEAYVAWLNGRRGRTSTNHGGTYRLPNEAEWEYAARAGTQTERWWGDDLGRDNADCNGCGSQWDAEQTAPVGSFRPNPFGFYDVLGNVFQWTADCWHSGYTGAPSDGSSWSTGDCGERVLRGSNWTNDPWVVRSASRTWGGIDERDNYIGFRVAKGGL